MTTDVINLTLKDQLRVLGRLLKYTLPFKGVLALAFTMLIISTIMGDDDTVSRNDFHR